MTGVGEGKWPVRCPELEAAQCRLALQRPCTDHCAFMTASAASIGSPSGALDREFRTRLLSSLRSVGEWEELAMKTTILAYVIALGGVAMIVFGLWGLLV